MQNIIYMDYYAKFQCIGGECPLTCCGGWDIALTEEEIRFYEKLPGPFGDKVMAGIDREKKVFRQKNSRCAMLTEDGWCKIVRECGEDALSATCVTFPRLSFEYGSIGEALVEIVCPVVAGYLFDSEQVGFGLQEIHEDSDNACDENLYFALSDMRGNLVDLFQTEQGKYDRGKIFILLKMQEYIRTLLETGQVLDRQEIQRYWEVYIQPENLNEIFLFGESLTGRISEQAGVLRLFLLNNYERTAFQFLFMKLKKYAFVDFIKKWMEDPSLFEKDLQQFLSFFREKYIVFPENYFVYFLFRDWIPSPLGKQAFGDEMTVRILEFVLIQIFAMTVFAKKGKVEVGDYEVLIAVSDRVFSHSEKLRADILSFTKQINLTQILLMLLL